MPSASYLMLRGCERIVFSWAFSPRTWIRGEGRDPSFDPTRTFHVSVEPPAGAADPPCDETRNSARDTSSLRAKRSNLAPVALIRSRLLRRSAPRNDGTMFLPSDDLCILTGSCHRDMDPRPSPGKRSLIGIVGIHSQALRSAPQEPAPGLNRGHVSKHTPVDAAVPSDSLTS